MKKILIVGLNMEIGGAERALLGLLNSFDYNNYKVDLFLQRHVGEFMSYIPKNVNLLDEIDEYTTLAVPLKDIIKKGFYMHALGRLYAKVKSKIYLSFNKCDLPSAVELEYSHKYTKQIMPMISNESYDLVISFCSPHYFALEKTKGKKKIAWIHTDYSAINIDVHSELEMWKGFDYIASISDECTESFCNRFSSLRNKIVRIDNIQSNNFIIDQSNEFDVNNEMPDFTNEYKFLSVGRFCYAKNFDNVPEICQILKNMGLNFKWYLIGFGGSENLIKEKIKEKNMQDHVIILGKKVNPYPYMKKCDIYIQPSRYEGKAVAVREAQILKKPVIITNFPTSLSQLKNNIDGFIVPLENKKCAEGIVDILNGKEKLDEVHRYLNEFSFSNESEVNKIYELIKE